MALEKLLGTREALQESQSTQEKNWQEATRLCCDQIRPTCKKLLEDHGLLHEDRRTLVANIVFPFQCIIERQTPRELASSRILRLTLESEEETMGVIIRSSRRTPQKSWFIDFRIEGIEEINDGFLRIYRNFAGIYPSENFAFMASGAGTIPRRKPTLEEVSVYLRALDLVKNQLAPAAPQ